MTNYEKERDEAAEKFAPGEYIAMADFKAGSDWSNAREEKRIQELESEVSRLTQNCKGLVSDHHKNLKRIQELEGQLQQEIMEYNYQNKLFEQQSEKIKTLEARLSEAENENKKLKENIEKIEMTSAYVNHQAKKTLRGDK